MAVSESGTGLQQAYSQWNDRRTRELALAGADLGRLFKLAKAAAAGHGGYEPDRLVHSPHSPTAAKTAGSLADERRRLSLSISAADLAFHQ
jgi:hypothetical protein